MVGKRSKDEKKNLAGTSGVKKGRETSPRAHIQKEKKRVRAIPIQFWAAKPKTGEWEKCALKSIAKREEEANNEKGSMRDLWQNRGC